MGLATHIAEKSSPAQGRAEETSGEELAQAICTNMIRTISSEAVGAYVVSTVSSEAVGAYVIRTIGSDAANISMGRAILCNYCCTNGVMCIDSGKCKGAAGKKRECKAEDQFVSFHGSCSRSIQCLGNSVWSELYSAQKY